MKNRAGWLALLVLAIATILMVFFVMPRVTGDKKPIGEAINKAGDAVQDVVTPDTNKAADTAAATASGTAEKMGRLAASAGAATAEMKALFADGKVPAADALAAAKAKLEASLKELAGIEAPAGTDAETTAFIGKQRDNARKALDLLKSFPSDAAGASTALAALDATLAGAGDTLGDQINTAAKDLKEMVDGSATAAIPAFDVLRVEPDGSTVIAGKAAPGSKLDILDGDVVISSTDVGETGDFAAVLDNPLPAGDHQLVLKATGKDGKSVVSEEVATVSVPKDANGDLLAMVSKPGKASRLITTPEAKKTATDTATVAGAQDKAVTQAGETPVDKPADTAAADTAVTTPPLADGATDTAATAPDASTDKTPGDTATTTANAKPTADAAASPEIQVTAVEIEADKIFVAGIAKPGAKVLAYADDQLIGSYTAGADGHFVVDGTMKLAVGDHSIRVDIVDAAGKVLVRAAVPFNRPAGEQVAAVIAQKGDKPGAIDAGITPLDHGVFDKMRKEATTAFALLKGLFAGGKVPVAEDLAAARSATEIALKSLSEFRLGTDASPTMKDIVTRTAQRAASALAALQALPQDAKSVGAALVSIEALIEETLKPAAELETTADKPAPAATQLVQDTPVSDDAAVTTDADATSQAGTQATAETTTGSEPQTIEQAPLQESKSSVIIRRGDTLWQISRRVYGKGIRYTTIYVANRDQISDPNKIQPGQTFGLPKDALPDSEEIHRKTVSGQTSE